MTARSRFSRRRFLTGLGGAVGVVASGALARSASGDSPFDLASGEMRVAGPLQPAQRLEHAADDPGIDESVAPRSGLVAPPPGRIAFPVATADDCFVTDNFGACRSGCARRHEGLDIMGSRHQPVYSVSGGRLDVLYVATPGRTYGAGHGWKIVDQDNDVVYKYFHLDRVEDGLAEGDTVEFGQIIGYVGNTGTSGVPSDSNYHLHFEYRPGNIAVDPRPLLVRPDNCTFT